MILLRLAALTLAAPLLLIGAALSCASWAILCVVTDLMKIARGR